MSNVPLAELAISVHCSACRARVRWPDDAVASTIIRCQECGAQVGTYGDLERAAREAGRKRAREISGKLAADLKKLFR